MSWFSDFRGSGGIDWSAVLPADAWVVFFGSGSFVCFGCYFNLVCGFEEVLADCSHGELGVSFCLPEVSGAVQVRRGRSIWFTT